jgi:hypothetical protein
LTDVAIEIGKYGALGRGEARNFGVGGVADQAENAFFTVFGEFGIVVSFAIDGGMVEFKVARMDDDTNRSV